MYHPIDRTLSVYVAGHAGLVGSAVGRRLRAAGFTDIRTVTRSQLDLRNQAEVSHWCKANRPEYVFLVAGTVGAFPPASKVCQAYRRQYGCDFISAMPTNLYGPNDNFDLNSGHVLPALIRKFHEAKVAGRADVEIWGTGSPMREFLHVDDLADACLFLMEHYSDDGHVNVGTGLDLSIRELAEKVRDVMYPGAELTFDTSKPDGTPRKVCGPDAQESPAARGGGPRRGRRWPDARHGSDPPPARRAAARRRARGRNRRRDPRSPRRWPPATAPGEQPATRKPPARCGLATTSRRRWRSKSTKPVTNSVGCSAVAARNECSSTPSALGAPSRDR